MKILTIISLLTSIYGGSLKPVIMPFTKGGTNDTGNTVYDNLLSASYWYSCEDWGYETQISAPQLLAINSVYPQTYILNINLQFRQPVEYAKVEVMLPNPRNTSGTADYNFVGDYCKITSNFTNKLVVECFNTSLVAIKLIYSVEQVEEYYGISRNILIATDPDENYWVTNGDLHCNVGYIYLKEVTLDTDIDYSTQFGSLLAYTDGLETLLSQIKNIINEIYEIDDSIMQYCMNINTNVTTIRSTLNTINTTLNNINTRLTNNYYLEQLYQAISETYRYAIKDINLVFKNDRYYTYQASGIVSTGPGQATLIYDNLYNEELHSELDRNKLKLVINLYSGNYIDNIFYIDIPYADTGSSTTTASINKSLYVLDKATSYVYYIKVLIYYNANKVSAGINVYRFTLSSPSTTSTVTSNTIIRHVYLTDNDITEVTLLDSINSSLELLMALEGVDVPTDDKEAVDNFFSTLMENMEMPDWEKTAPNTIDPLFHTMNLVKDIINLPQLSLFKWLLLFECVVIVFRVVVT